MVDIVLTPNLAPNDPVTRAGVPTDLKLVMYSNSPANANDVFARPYNVDNVPNETQNQSISGDMGALTGALVRTTQKALSGLFGLDGGILSRLTSKVLSGTSGALTGSLNVAHYLFRSVAGTVGNLTGGVSRTTNKTLAGVLGALTGAVSSIWTKSVTRGGGRGVMIATKAPGLAIAATRAPVSIMAPSRQQALTNGSIIHNVDPDATVVSNNPAGVTAPSQSPKRKTEVTAAPEKR